ncbi:rhodanese domain-containing protein [Pseudomonas putida]|nr:rhodanese domain-containing protein [Pseudomonas putida]
MRHTPSLAAEQVQALLDDKADVVVLDARRFDEYQTMSIPGGISVPGAELVLRVAELAPSPATQVIVNCAGRTRSIIGTQSLVNAGIPNPVAALRNGTIGWTLAGQTLAHGQERRFAEVSDNTRANAAQRARNVADRAGVLRLEREALAVWQADTRRTTYLFDVRTPEEYAHGHLPASRSVPGGQLVQETDHVASVRGARIVLVDDDGVRANMSGFLAGANGLAGRRARWRCRRKISARPVIGRLPNRHCPQSTEIGVEQLDDWLQTPGTVVLDFTTSANYVKRHIPGAHWAIRAQLPQVLEQLPVAERYVLTCGSSLLARFAAVDLQALTQTPVYVTGRRHGAVDCGRQAAGKWRKAPGGGAYRPLSPAYEGTDNPREAMQGYLDWEFGLIAQLERDGTHGFNVLS